MLDFILKVLGHEYRAFRLKPRYMEINLGGTGNPLESPHQIVHSAMHMQLCPGPDGFDISNRICMFARHYSRISPVDQMLMYASNRRKNEQKLGMPIKAYMADVTFDNMFADEVRKLSTEEEDKKNV